MLAMENTSRPNRSSHLNSSLKQRRSGYEPSDTETEWQDSPWNDLKTTTADRPKTPGRSNSPLSINKRYLSNHDYDMESTTRVSKTKTSPIRRKNSSRSPYKPRRDDTTSVVSPYRNASPLLRPERRNRHLSPCKTKREDVRVIDDEEDIVISSSIKQNHYRTPPKRVNLDGDGNHLRLLEVSRVSERLNYSHRSISAPKPRAREREEHSVLAFTERRGESLIRKHKEIQHLISPSASEINELAGATKLRQGQGLVTESECSGDIFFSHECSGLTTQKNLLSKKNGCRNSFPPRPKIVSERDTGLHERSRIKGSFNQNIRVVSSSTTSRSNTTSSSALNGLSRTKSITDSSKISDGSRSSSDSFRKFTTNVQKIQKDTWFGCVRKGPCRTSKSPHRSPEARDIEEASYIEKAFVVENLRQFWADKHQPASLSGFTCHEQEAQILKQLILHNSCPHILFKGPPGSGKKALTMALLREIFGDPAWNISHDLRYFYIQENSPMQVVVPLASSPHHTELNLNSEANARYALMGLVKEIINNHGIIPEISIIDSTPDYKVIVLYEVDKVAENIQHLIKWITDCYTDACKIILCCENDVDILDSIKSRCKVIKVDAPVTHEIMEVLIQIARKENFDLPMNFAAKIATKSKQNLRKAIMALEACKAHNYPFVDEQPIPLGWEESLVELAAEILADPSPKRLFFIRGKFQKLLVDFVHPKLILQKLVEQFLKGVEASLKRELYYWHAYYEKRLPIGTSALLKLEEFMAKFMSIYRKSLRGRPFPL